MQENQEHQPTLRTSPFKSIQPSESACSQHVGLKHEARGQETVVPEPAQTDTNLEQGLICIWGLLSPFRKTHSMTPPPGAGPGQRQHERELQDLEGWQLGG